MQDNNRIRPFFVLWSGQVVSLVGTQAVQFALIWWLAERTGSAAVLATATLVGLLPITLLGPWAGAVADRRSRKAVLLLSDGAAALVSAALALAFFVGAAGSAAALAALLLRAIASAFHGPAMLAVTSSMVPARHLTRVQGLNQAVQGGMLIVSAPLGALLVAWLPMGGVLLVDVATALVAIVPLAALRIPAPARSANGAAARGSSTWDDLREGLRYVARHGGHRALLGLAASINMAIVPAYSLLPLLIQGPLAGGAGTLGTAQSLFGVGTLAGGAVLGVWGGTRRRTRTALAAIAGIGIATLALGLAPAGSPAWVAGAMLAVGVLAALSNGPIVAILQATVPLELQGRVFGLYGSLATLATPLGLVLAAPVAQLVGVRAWYVFGGIACAALAILGSVSRSVATLDVPVDTCAGEPVDERGRGAA